MTYTSCSKQLSLDAFRSSLSYLPKNNRWVQLGDHLPWDDIERLYNSKLNNGKRGAGNKPARMIIGALLIKHKMNLSDEETILAIQENPYMQYFVGLSEFTDRLIFDSSLFVAIRKRLGATDFNDMSVSLLTMQLEKAKKESEKNDRQDNQSSGGANSLLEGSVSDTPPEGVTHKGSLKIDATCCDAEVRYPTDIDLLYDGCKVIDRYIDKLCRTFFLPHPSTHHKEARKAYLEVIKRKKKSKELLRSGKSHLLTYLVRDMHTFAHLIATGDTSLFYSLKRHEQRTVGAIIKMFHQQKEMFKSDTRTCTDRIISIFQSHIRPIVRGKSKSPTEFGAKIGVSVVEGYTFVDHHSWDAYNEASDLKEQVELYKSRFGFYPHKVFADKIYLNRVNRSLLKELGIQAMGKPLGRPSKESKEGQTQAQNIQAVSKRNEVEATFGTGKRIYRANNIRAKLPDTANSWVGMCYFAKNVMKFLKELLHALFLLMELVENPANKWEIKKGMIKYA